MSNPIRGIVESRIVSLLEVSRSLDSIPHDSTRGELREEFLAEFLEELIPAHLKIAKGMICDSTGLCAKQTDLIVYDPSVLPSLILTSRVGVIPIEAVHLIAEIKSTISTATLKQVDEQIQTLHSLRIADRRFSAEPDVTVPAIVLGYSCDVAMDTLRKWLEDSEKRPNLVSVCIIGSFALLRVGPKNVSVVEAGENAKMRPTLRFIHCLYTALEEVAKERRKLKADWGQYLDDH